MNVATLPRKGCRRALALVMGLALTAGVAAQTPSAPNAAPAPAKATKATKATKAAKPPAAPEFKLVLEPRAMDLLKATGARLAAAKSMSFTATVGYEYPSKLGPPIVYTTRYDVTMQRPDKLRIVTPGDGPATEFYYDGKAMMAYAPAENLVAVADAPPTIDAALKAAYDTAAIFFPFTDLVVADPYAALTDGAILAFVIGPSVTVGGTKTDMLAWANGDVFLQIWIGADDKLPRRIRAIYRTDPLELRHELELSNWQLDGTIAPDAFASQKAKAAKRIAFASPVAAAGAVVGMAVGAAAASSNTAAATSTAYNQGVAAGSAGTAAATSAANGAGVQAGAAAAGAPAGAISIDKGGATYYLSGNTWFQPSYGANGVYYTVVPAP